MEIEKENNERENRMGKVFGTKTENLLIYLNLDKTWKLVGPLRGEQNMRSFSFFRVQIKLDLIYSWACDRFRHIRQ